MTDDPAVGEFFRKLSESLAGSKERERLTIAAYESDPKRAREVMVLMYRCKARGNLLLIAWQSPAGVLFYKPRYKLERTRNLVDSNESGRRANTEDGKNHWRSSAGLLDDLRGLIDDEGFRFHLACDHVQPTVTARQLLSDADAGSPGRPTRRTL